MDADFCVEALEAAIALAMTAALERLMKGTKTETSYLAS
jgi:hypothetical protein